MYVIINRNSLEGFQAGYFKLLSNLWLVGEISYLPDDSQRERSFDWSHKMHEARTFDTEQEAWTYAFDIWGMGFATSEFMVVSVRPEAMKNSEAKTDHLHIVGRR